MKTEKQSIVPKSFIVMMMVMLGIALLPIRYYGYYVVDHAKPNFSKPQRDDSGCLS